MMAGWGLRSAPVDVARLSPHGCSTAQRIGHIVHICHHRDAVEGHNRLNADIVLGVPVPESPPLGRPQRTCTRPALPAAPAEQTERAKAGGEERKGRG